MQGRKRRKKREGRKGGMGDEIQRTDFLIRDFFTQRGHNSRRIEW